jgi:uncharacterized membrane protein (UPF0127 family)/CheY-like chemotaxis protein
MAHREGRVEFDGGVVCERCLVADSFRLRLRGLLGRRSIAGDEGLLLIGSPSIHTTFMRFPIDALFLDRELAVIGLKAGLKPWRIAGRWKAKHILELRAGEAARRGVGLGAHLRLIEPASAPTTSLQPRKDPVSIRVLVGASDRRFLRVASFLLGRSGFAVANATRLPDLMDAVEHGRADVVVLDASSPERWPVRAAAALEAATTGVAVLLVGDGGDAAAATLPKWGSFDRLVDEIRAAHARREPAEVLSA